MPLYATLPGSPISIEDRVRYCENLYAREQQQTIFRLTSISPYPELDEFLVQRGYQLLDPAVVELRQFAEHPPAPDRWQTQTWSIRFATVGLEPWLDVYTQLAEVPESAKRLHGAILGGIQALCGFGVLYASRDDKPSDERPVACGLAVAEADFVGLFDIVTNPKERQQGYGRLLVEHLLRWGAAADAKAAYLQVMEANQPALALYQSLAFQPLYRYWYRAA